MNVHTSVTGQLTAVLVGLEPGTVTSSATYNVDGDQVTATDADGDVTTSSYDADNELTSETLGYGTAAAITQAYTYDNDGNKTSYTDGAGNETTYAYNTLDQLVSETDPLGKTTSYTYDDDGNVLTVTNPDSKVTTNTYYNNDQLDTTSYSDGTTHSVTYTYDPDGTVATMADASGTSTYTYDDADRLTSYENGAGNTVSYGYDAAGNVTTLTYPGSHAVTYAYNDLEQMTSVTDWNSKETQFGYDASGAIDSVTYPNDVATAASFNNADQVASITDTNTSTSTTIATMSYGRDSAGLLTSENDAGLPATPSSFGYNALHELGSAGASSFSYNSAEDLTTAPGGQTQAFNADDEACWTGSGSGACGSPPSGATTYTYSNEGNRTATSPSTGTSYAYSYDEANDLTEATPSSGTATSYVSDGSGLLQSETTGSTTTQYTWEVNASVPNLLEDGTNYYVYGPQGTPVEQIDVSSGNPSYLLTDQLGSVRAITNGSGTVTGTFSYDAWGNETGSTGSETTPFGFAGAYLDPSNGLYYLRARWYDPTTGQFMSLDPLAAQTLQPYQYVGNDPLNGWDPTGLKCDDACQAAANAASYAIIAALEASTTYGQLQNAQKVAGEIEDDIASGDSGALTMNTSTELTVASENETASLDGAGVSGQYGEGLSSIWVANEDSNEVSSAEQAAGNAQSTASPPAISAGHIVDDVIGAVKSQDASVQNTIAPVANLAEAPVNPVRALRSTEAAANRITWTCLLQGLTGVGVGADAGTFYGSLLYRQTRGAVDLIDHATVGGAIGGAVFECVTPEGSIP